MANEDQDLERWIEEIEKEDTQLVPDCEGNTIRLHDLGNGEYYPAFPNIKARLEKMKAFEAREDDIWINSFTRSGNNWHQEIVTMILQSSSKATSAMLKMNNHFEMWDHELFDAKPSPRTINAHLIHSRIPPDVWMKKSKIIYILRNPKDVAVSNYNWYIDTGFMYGYTGTFNGFISLFLEGKVGRGSWFTHVRDWWKKEKENPNVLFLTYEQSKRDLERTVKRISEFLGRNLASDVIQSIVDQCSFNVMKEHKGSVAKQKMREGAHGFYRKGEVGDWKNWFTIAQNEKFDAVYQEKMKDVDDIPIQFTI
ncbi:unnamed protein product [Owenia fusiformis]|uniref:Sulfotransferase domain-containing protein n=1 Tax=Owenia fusiformis TaxID=6347 RepID=A0A8S4NRX6_OWEFU|nr:unnamed protein product [Owenia fusiformis]